MIKIIPFFKKKYESKLSDSRILDRIRQRVSPPDWNVSLSKMMDHKILEGKVVNNEFLISNEKYGLTYGKANFLPILKGIVIAGPPGNNTSVRIVIRPSVFIVVSYVVLVFLMGTLSRYGLKQGDFSVFGMSIFFILGPYISLLIRFNRAVSLYLRFIEDEILEQN